MQERAVSRLNVYLNLTTHFQASLPTAYSCVNIESHNFLVSFRHQPCYFNNSKARVNNINIHR